MQEMPHDITGLLKAVEQGSESAERELFAAVYDELRMVARGQMQKERVGHTLQPTALVNEACLKLMGAPASGFDNRRHFFSAAARAMRRVLVEHGRRRQAEKRGGGRGRVTISAIAAGDASGEIDVVDLDDALNDLEREFELASQVVVLRYFAGMTVVEAAEILDVSERTIKREWRFARAWLVDRLGQS